ncbi:hypothetical protein [Xanthobacter autotrophicus]|uniref:hypothetical protein n=1 Tax=Xanthobacter autotrophicus TaxID=280 RepID=UPI0037289E54
MPSLTRMGLHQRKGYQPPLFALTIEAEWRKRAVSVVPAQPKARPEGQRHRYRSCLHQVNLLDCRRLHTALFYVGLVETTPSASPARQTDKAFRVTALHVANRQIIKRGIYIGRELRFDLRLLGGRKINSSE